MKTFKTYRAALEASLGMPILRVTDCVDGKMQNLFIVPEGKHSGLTEIAVIDTMTDKIAGNVGMKHLARLGNANHATPSPHWAERCTPDLFDR